MNHNEAMMSASMLEAIWESRKKDMIDLITPFVMYATASLTAPGQKINTKDVQNYVQQKFAYKDMPEIIIKKVLARKPYSAVERRDSGYYLIVPIDSEIERMESRKEKCVTYLHSLGKSLSTYLNEHCQKATGFTEQKAIDCLHVFFSRYGLQVGTDDLASVSISPKDYEIDYYIARFIFECKDNNREEYQYLTDLIKGYFLRLAIYIQPENSNIKSASYSNTTFFYDTPFLLDLLGYSSMERQNNATLLHNMLKRQGGTFRYFPHVRQEIIDILSAYKHSLSSTASSNSFRTLEGLNIRNYNASDVEREIDLLASRLENCFGIVEQDIPAYEVKNDGSVDEKKVLAEKELKQFIRDNTAHYSEDNLENDVKSALAIHRLRGDSVSSNIESCRYIFVTNNYDFTNVFNTYYRNNVNKDTFQLIISDSNLAAITWIKTGEVNGLPESELLKNAYCAMQPIPEIMKKVEEVFQKLKLAGKLDSSQIVALRASRVFQNEIWLHSFGETENVTESSVKAAQKKYETQLIASESAKYQAELDKNNQEHELKIDLLNKEMEEKSKKHEQELSSMKCALDKKQKEVIEQRKMQAETNRKSADAYAKSEREKWYMSRKRILSWIFKIISVLGALGTIASFSLNQNLVLSIMLGFATALAVISAIDTVSGRQKFALKLLDKKANQYETKVREAKLQEYSALTNIAEGREK